MKKLLLKRPSFGLVLIIGLLVFVTVGGPAILSLHTINNKTVKGTSTLNNVLEDPTIFPTNTPIPTEMPTPTPFVQNNTGNNSIIDCVGPDGKHLQLTQKACDDFNASWNKYPNSYYTSPPNNGSNTNNNQHSYPNYVTIPCTTSTGTYMETGSDYADAQKNCDDLKNYHIPTTTIYYPTASSPTPIPTVDYSYQNQQCKANAAQTYQAEQQPCAQYGGTSAYDFCLQVAQQHYTQAVGYCNNQYPVN